MSRFLMVVPPLAGHVNPTVAVGRELQQRGHQVAWAGHPALVPPLLPEGCRLLPAGGAFSETQIRAARQRWIDLRAFAALKALWDEVLIPLAYAMVEGVEEAVEAFGPDVVVADQQALAGGAVARRRALPWATSASTFSELTRPYASMPKIEDWVAGVVADFQRAHGAGAGDLRFSEHLVVVYSTPELAGSVEIARNAAFVGPAIGERPSGPAFPWEWIDPSRPLVLASLGTHNGEAGARFYRVLLEAAGGEVQVVVVAPPGLLGPVPPNVLVRDAVPQLRLLPHVDAVVTHGGINTVSESLLHAVPMVVAPIRDDQPVIAARVAAAGAGIQVRFGRVQADELGTALRAVLQGPRYREAARRIGDAFAAAGGAAAAADHFEKLAR